MNNNVVICIHDIVNTPQYARAYWIIDDPAIMVQPSDDQPVVESEPEMSLTEAELGTFPIDEPISPARVVDDHDDSLSLSHSDASSIVSYNVTYVTYASDDESTA